jgi:hypothetical protein
MNERAKNEAQVLRDELEQTRADVAATVDEIADRVKAPAGPVIAIVAVAATAIAAYVALKFGRPRGRRRGRRR